MPQVQYANPAEGVNIVKMMQTPIKVADINAWFKQACKVIPEIPARWYRVDELVTDKTIVFELIDIKTRAKCAVVIARKA